LIEIWMLRESMENLRLLLMRAVCRASSVIYMIAIGMSKMKTI
jgi:hypothetical protein